jgi:hypothetical protein
LAVTPPIIVGWCWASRLGGFLAGLILAGCSRG